jgi:5-hydroxyisourate hydrolase
MARLTTHVLDLAHGKPAVGMRIQLYGCEGEVRRLLRSFETSDDGRVPPQQVETGVYELVFAVGAYFRAQGVALPNPAFLEDVAVRFGIADAEAGYHVPLLASPYGYSTYRGS